MNIKVYYILFGVIILIIGIAIGVFTKNFAFFTLDKSIKINEVFDTCIALFIGLIVPLLFKKYFDKNDIISGGLIEELNLFENKTVEIQSFLEQIYNKSSITNAEKERVTTIFDFYDIDILRLSVCIDDYPSKNKFKDDYEILKNKNIALWKLATSNLITSRSVKKIDDETYKKIKICFAEIFAQIRKVKTKAKIL